MSYLVLQAKQRVPIRLTVPPSSQPTEIVVNLEQVRGKQFARIGFDAPAQVKILRDDARPKDPHAD